MKANEVVFQSEKFLRWHGRAGDDLETNFRWWAQGKDFSPDDERTVWGVVREILAKSDLRAEVSIEAVSAA